MGKKARRIMTEDEEEQYGEYVKMGEEYNPQPYDRFPHVRYECECGRSAVAVGNEVETIICDACGLAMDWKEDLHHPWDG